MTLARYHYYDGLVFHRIIREFMIQGGCSQGSGRGCRFPASPTPPAAGRYQVAYVAISNAGPNINGSQFFIARAPTASSFHRILPVRQADSGEDVLQEIQSVPTGG